MSENDPLRAVLREWAPPEPSAAMDARVREGFRAARPPSPWERFWSGRVTVPVPVLAALALVAAMVWLIELRPAQPAPERPRYVTKVEATGFQPVPDGLARVEEVKQ